MDASNGGQDTIIQLGGGTAFSSLDGSQMMGFDRDDEVYVLVTPNDGTDNGTTVESDHAIVLNTAPSAPSVTVTSTANPPLEMVDDLDCSIVSPSTDDDGDSITYTYTWYDPNGVDVQVVPGTTFLSDTFPGSATTAGLWECVVEASDGTDTASSSADIEVDADWNGALTFTNCGQTGATGPSQSQCDSEYSGSTLDGLVSVSAGYQTWTVNTTGTYSIQGAGASGGAYSYPAGNGAVMMGEFTLTAGDQVTIVVGQQGLTGGQGGGGGGGTFVVLNQSTPLVVAGGGGGSHYNRGSDTAKGGGVGTTGPANSSTGSGYRSGSGGGWFADGQNGDYAAQGGLGWSNGLVGGMYATSPGVGSHWSNARGGFGGGGGGCW